MDVSLPVIHHAGGDGSQGLIKACEGSKAWDILISKNRDGYTHRHTQKYKMKTENNSSGHFTARQAWFNKLGCQGFNKNDLSFAYTATKSNLSDKISIQKLQNYIQKYKKD